MSVRFVSRADAIHDVVVNKTFEVGRDGKFVTLEGVQGFWIKRKTGENGDEAMRSEFKRKEKREFCWRTYGVKEDIRARDNRKTRP